MNKQVFFDNLRTSLFGSLSSSQVQGLEYLLEESYKHELSIPQMAYCLATAYHETAKTMLPIAEYGRGKGRPYGVPTDPYGYVYYGRGYVQLTWNYNYHTAGDALGVDLVRYPEKAMDPKIAADVLFLGMKQGWFTTRKLSDYINGNIKDYINARRIVNGVDKAVTIAGYAQKFETALVASGYGKEPVSIQVDVPAPRPPVVVEEKPNLLTTIINILIKLFGGAK